MELHTENDVDQIEEAGAHTQKTVDYFLDELMNKYGTGETMPFEGFEHLLETLQLGNIVFIDHAVECHWANDKSEFTPLHPSHNHTEEAAMSANTPCLREGNDHDSHDPDATRKLHVHRKQGHLHKHGHDDIEHRHAHEKHHVHHQHGHDTDEGQIHDKHRLEHESADSHDEPDYSDNLNRHVHSDYLDRSINTDGEQSDDHPEYGHSVDEIDEDQGRLGEKQMDGNQDHLDEIHKHKHLSEYGHPPEQTPESNIDSAEHLDTIHGHEDQLDHEHKHTETNDRSDDHTELFDRNHKRKGVLDGHHEHMNISDNTHNNKHHSGSDKHSDQSDQNETHEDHLDESNSDPKHKPNDPSLHDHGYRERLDHGHENKDHSDLDYERIAVSDQIHDRKNQSDPNYKHRDYHEHNNDQLGRNNTDKDHSDHDYTHKDDQNNAFQTIKQSDNVQSNDQDNDTDSKQKEQSYHKPIDHIGQDHQDQGSRTEDHNIEETSQFEELAKVGHIEEIDEDTKEPEAAHHDRKRPFVTYKKRSTGNNYEECLQPSNMLDLIATDITRGLSRDMFVRLCPTLIYQIESGSCRRHHDDHDHLHGDHLHGDHLHDDHLHDDHQHDRSAVSAEISGVSARVWGFSTIAVVIISLVGLLGVAVIPIVQKVFYNHLLQFLVALAVGALTGDALLHLLPHAISGGHEHVHGDVKGQGHGSPGGASRGHDLTPIYKGLCGLLGIFFFFLTERMIAMITDAKRRNKKTNRRYSIEDQKTEEAIVERLANAEKDNGDDTTHTIDPSNSHGDEVTIVTINPKGQGHGHSHCPDGVPSTVSAIAWMVIMGDGIHNFSDGLAIGAAFANSITGGFSTSVAVFCHELPHEIGDFAMLLKAGMSPKQAIMYNCVSSILCFVGMLIGVAIGNVQNASLWIFAAVAGMFLYIALVDMLPELSSADTRQAGSPCIHLMLQLLGMLIGAGIMMVIALYEENLQNIFQ